MDWINSLVPSLASPTPQSFIAQGQNALYRLDNGVIESNGLIDECESRDKHNFNLMSLVAIDEALRISLPSSSIRRCLAQQSALAPSLQSHRPLGWWTCGGL